MFVVAVVVFRAREQTTITAVGPAEVAAFVGQILNGQRECSTCSQVNCAVVASAKLAVYA